MGNDNNLVVLFILGCLAEAAMMILMMMATPPRIPRLRTKRPANAWGNKFNWRY